MKYLLLFALILTLLTACSNQEQSNKDFINLSENYINALMDSSPEFATYLGNHNYDDKLNDYSSEGYQKELDMYKSFLASLQKIKAEDLNQNNLIDYKIMESNLKSSIFSIDTLRGH